MDGSESWLAAIMWMALLLPLYSYALFPPLILAWGALAARRKPRSAAAKDGIEPGALPEVAIVVSAHNEEQHIDGLLGNLRSLNYPHEPMLYLGSDGSTDR